MSRVLSRDHMLTCISFYEAQAAEDPFEGCLPTMDRVLEPLEPANVVEDLWSDYKNRASLPLQLS